MNAETFPYANHTSLVYNVYMCIRQQGDQ